MNEKKKLKIINNCLEQVQSGIRTEEECLKVYPELEKELKNAFLVFRSLQQLAFPRLSYQRQKVLKERLLFSLPDRDAAVTKTRRFRFKWQNMQRRFAMTWLIIAATLFSLVSGAGVVYASNAALPGEMLYPVKTWVEDVQLALAPDDLGIQLIEQFTDHRIDELVALSENGELESLADLLPVYQNRIELMMEQLAKVEANNPEEATRLRSEINSQYQAHARIIEGILPITDESNPVKERLREMLQSNTQTRLRINKIVIEPEPVLAADPGSDKSGSSEMEAKPAAESQSQPQNQNQNQNRVIDLPAEFLEDGTLKFQFRFDQPPASGVFAEIGGARFGCVVEGTQATCDLTGAPGNGRLNLFQLDPNLLLYSYDYHHDYEYLWQGAKESGGPQSQVQGSPENENGNRESGQNGKK